MPTVEESIYAHLSTDEPLTGLVGSRIFPSQVPDYEPETPWAYYVITESDPTDFEDIEEATVQSVSSVEFAVFADNYADARDVADAIRSRLNGFRGGQVDRCFWDGSNAEPAEEGYMFSVRFKVWGSDAEFIPSELGLPRVEVRADGIYLDGAIAAGVGEQGPPGEDGTPGPVSEGTTVELLAGENLSALRAVIISPTTGRAVYATNADLSHAGRIVGVTLTAAIAGEPVTVRTSGQVTECSWTWPGASGIFLGTAGALVQGYTGGVFAERLGSVSSTTSFFLRVDPPILFS